MRTFRVTLTLVAALMLGLAMTSTASAVAVDVINGDFQTPEMFENWSDDAIAYWYDRSTPGYDKLWMDEVGTYSYGAGSTTVCEFTNDQRLWHGYIYQQIGTYTENEQIEVTGTLLRREQHNTGMLRLTLHVGSGTPSDDTDVYDFAGLVDTVHVDGDADLGLGLTGSGPYSSPAASANFSVTLDSGTGHTVGDPIWLRLTADFGSWAVVAVDNLALPGAKSADLDGDGFVDTNDLQVIQNSWGLAPGDPGFDAAYDLNGDDLITLPDAEIIRQKWFPNSGSAATSVPEPGSLVLLTIGSLALLVLRRRCRIC